MSAADRKTLNERQLCLFLKSSDFINAVLIKHGHENQDFDRDELTRMVLLNEITEYLLSFPNSVEDRLYTHLTFLHKCVQAEYKKIIKENRVLFLGHHFKSIDEYIQEDFYSQYLTTKERTKALEYFESAIIYKNIEFKKLSIEDRNCFFFYWHEILHRNYFIRSSDLFFIMEQLFILLKNKILQQKDKSISIYTNHRPYTFTTITLFQNG